jgi:hypothetical protein
MNYFLRKIYERTILNESVIFNHSLVQNGAWTKEQQNLFNVSKTGTGPGEYSVASLLTGSVDINELNKYVQGESVSYDVMVDNLTFEVKKTPSARIGKEGLPLMRLIQKSLFELLQPIKDKYDSLSDENKGVVDNDMRNIIFPNLMEPKGKEGSSSLNERRKQHNDLKSWTIGKYIDAVFEDINEISITLINGDKIYAGKYRDLRGSVFYISIKQLINYLNKYVQDAEHYHNTRINDIVGAITSTYAINDPDEETTSFINNEVEKLDHVILKNACKNYKHLCPSTNQFKHTLNKMNLLNRFHKLESYFIDPQYVTELFPKSITGFFWVNENGYKYAPKMQIGDFVKISHLSSKGLKISIK